MKTNLDVEVSDGAIQEGDPGEGDLAPADRALARRARAIFVRRFRRSDAKLPLFRHFYCLTVTEKKRNT